MKKVLALGLLCMAAVSSKAALFITNNTTCPINMSIRAHDLNHATECSLQAIEISVGGGSSQAYNNVASLNVTPGWYGGVTAVTTGGTTVWGWDSVKFYATAGGVFGSWLGSACSPVSSITFPNACSGVTVVATWTTIGGNTFVDFN